MISQGRRGDAEGFVREMGLLAGFAREKRGIGDGFAREKRGR